MDERLFFPATKRNCNAIGAVLTDFLPQNGICLEIASGSGEHATAFQRKFPSIIWQSSDPDTSCRKSINSWIKHQELHEKMPSPIDLSVERTPWPLTKEISLKLTSIVCINLIHIAPWKCTICLFKESGRFLQKDCPLILYGPFKREGKHTSESNSIFDSSLKTKNISWGIRDLEEVIKVAKNSGFNRTFIIEMPANNLSVIFIRN